MNTSAPGALSQGGGAGGSLSGLSWHSFLPHGQLLWIVVVLIVLLVVVGCWRRYGMARAATRPPVEATADDREESVAVQRLRDLASLRNQGLVSVDEYETKRAEILANV